MNESIFAMLRIESVFTKGVVQKALKLKGKGLKRIKVTNR